MTDLQLGIPITIEGQEVIIFRDAIGSDVLASGRDAEVLTVVETMAADGRPAIYIDENELRTLRENFPGTNVYGLWQLLFANDQVPLGKQVVIFPTSESGGLYLQMKQESDYDNPANIRMSAEYIDNYAADLHDFDLPEATRIRVDVSALKLPANPAFTRVELFAKKQGERTKRWYLAISVCVVLVASAAVYNYSMFTVYRMNMAEYTSKKQQSQALEARSEALLKERLPVRPDNSEVMDRIDSVLAYDSRISTPTVGGHVNAFPATHVFLTRPNFPANLSGKIPGVQVELTPQMRYLLTVSADAPGVSN
ncbi:hypothetical protein [Pseudomonas violetae]|uniref:Uncharacterized protein n=1 Tax=Pseudomonas violetae TaxID=2915813 RepID=A0ABT0ESJ6_9PSED|nr:hypothetical protein [Pseudomonas violetae]MCK1788704.1 hypothetical protein [Pseudomonas violetae]